MTHRSSTTSEGGLKALQLAQRPFLSDLPRNLRRQLTWELGEPIRGDAQRMGGGRHMPIETRGVNMCGDDVVELGEAIKTCFGL